MNEPQENTDTPHVRRSAIETPGGAPPQAGARVATQFANASPALVIRRRILAAGAATAASALVASLIYAGLNWRAPCGGDCAGERTAGDRTASAITRVDGPAQPAAPRAMPPLPASIPPPPALTDPALIVNDRPLAPPPTGVPTAPLREALAAYRDGKLAEGDAAALHVKDGAAQALLEWIAIRYNGPSMGFGRINDFLQRYPDWPASGMVQRQAEYALMRARAQPGLVAKFFHERRPATPHGALLLAESLAELNQGDAARQLVIRTWRNAPMPAALEKRFIERFPDVLVTVEHRNRMEHFLLENRWDAALRAASYASPDHVRLARARMAVVQPRQPGKAAERALAAVPEKLRKDVSWRYSRAVLLRKQGDNAGALAIHMDTPVSELQVDGGDEWWIERRILARRFLDNGKPDVAYRLVRQHGAERDALRIEAEFHAGWIALRQLGRPRDALRHFDAAADLAGTPVSLARTRYWRGRAHEALGELVNARADYAEAAGHSTTFYGQMARIKLGEQGLGLEAPPVASDGALDLAPIRAIRLLHEADMDDMAIPLYLGVARTATDAGTVDLVARLAANRNDARAMVLIGKAAMQRGFPLAHAAWPVQGVPAFTPAERAVERAMVLAITRQESVFDPAAVSPAGARGLMQLMPATAQRTAKSAGAPFDASRLTADPAYNAMLGAHHLTELLDDWDGSYLLAFAAYNAGGGNVKKWLSAHGDPRDPAVDPVDWIELIPFGETRNYVQRVVENLQVYRERLQPGAPLRLAEDLKRGVSGRGDAPIHPSERMLVAENTIHKQDEPQTTSSITPHKPAQP